MGRIQLKLLLFICSSCVFQIAYADLPLTVENLISDKGKVTIEAGLTYGNNKISNAKTVGYIPVQISDTSFVNVPTVIRNEQVQNEYIIANIGAKYGVIQNLDVSLRTNFLYSSNRFLDVDATEKSKTDSDIADISVGANYQFLQDAKYPALVGFIETTVFEKSENKNSNFSNWTVGFTSYRSYDPMVLSLTAGYKYSLEREFDDINDYKPADLLFINPQFAFSANDRISLIAGLNFKYLSDQKFNNQIVSKKRNNLDYSFGLGYGVNDQSNLNLITTIRQDFDNSSEVRLVYNKKL